MSPLFGQNKEILSYNSANGKEISKGRPTQNLKYVKGKKQENVFII